MSEPNPKTPKLPTYTNEEVASILSRALDRQHEGGRISHDELLETAREIGVSTLEFEASVADEVKARAERLVREEAQQQAKRRFLQHFVGYVVTSAIAVAVDKQFAGSAGMLGVLAVVAVWGVAVAIHAKRTFPSGDGAPPGAAPPTTTRIEVLDGKVRAIGPGGGKG